MGKKYFYYQQINLQLHPKIFFPKTNNKKSRTHISHDFSLILFALKPYLHFYNHNILNNPIDPPVPQPPENRCGQQDYRPRRRDSLDHGIRKAIHISRQVSVVSKTVDINIIAVQKPRRNRLEGRHLRRTRRHHQGDSQIPQPYLQRRQCSGSIRHQRHHLAGRITIFPHTRHLQGKTRPLVLVAQRQQIQVCTGGRLLVPIGGFFGHQQGERPRLLPEARQGIWRGGVPNVGVLPRQDQDKRHQDMFCPSGRNHPRGRKTNVEL